MATIGLKAKDEKLHDDFDDFNFDDFDFDAVEPEDDRHPVLKTIAPIGKGARDYITNPVSIEKFVKAAMPMGYGQAYDMGSEAVGELKQLYNSAAEEIKPVKELSKKLLRKALPSLDGKIPKGLKQKLENFSKEEEQWQARQNDAREEQLGALLTSIFEQKAKDEVRQQTEGNEREKIRQGFEQIRHRDQISQLDAIRIAVESQVQFQNKVTFNVQKKQLEMSYRMFWAMADLNKEQKRSNAEMLTELKATRKNTGLPDYAKQTTVEKFKELARNKFLETTREGMFGGARDYFRKFARNIGDQALGRLRDYTQMAGAMGEVADGASGMMEGMEGMSGFNARDELIAQLTQLPMDWLAERGAQKANKLLSKSSKLRRGGNKAAYIANTAGDRLHEYLTSYERNWGSFEALREMLASAAPSHTPESRMEVDNINRMHEAMPFQRSTKKSIEEVIPGLLARIHREIKILRTGDESTGLITYDFTKNKFSTDKTIASDLKQRIAGSNTKRANAYADQILNKVDRSGKLTPEQRERARKMLIEKSVMGESIDIKNIHTRQSWGGDEDGQAIADRFSRYLRAEDGKLADNDQSYRRQLDLINSHRGIVGGIGDPRVLIQQMVNAGQLENLKDMGILDENNTVDRKVFAKWLSGEETSTPTPAQTQPTPRPAGIKSGRKLGRRPQQQAAAAPAAPAVSASNSAQLAPRVDATVSRHGEEMVNELRTISAALAGKKSEVVGSTVEKNVQTITDLLASLDGKYSHASDANYEVLNEMLQRLGEIASNSAGGGQGTGGSDIRGGRIRSFTSLWEHLKSSGEETLHKAKVHAKLIKRKGMRLWDKYAPKAQEKIEQGATFIGGKLKDLKGKLEGYYGDVVVSGETFPRLRATLLKAGEYRDKLTGRVITSLEDITGDVVDSSGNVVITMEEFYNSYVTGSINKKVRELFTKAKSRLEEWKSRLQDFIPGAIKDIKSRAMGAFNTIKKLLPPYDVYVKTDMKRPLMYANMMRYEMYFSQRTGNVIKHPREIDGPVIDEMGNIVVSEEHIKEGLVDIAGDPVGRGLTRLLSKGIRKASQAWEVMRNAAVGIFGAIGKGLGNASEYFKNFFAPFADMITNSRKTVDLLQQIHDMLDARLPGGKKVRGDLDGDGIRDGSIEDIKRKRESEEDDGKGKDGEDGAGGSKSGGMISKLLAGIGGLFNRKKKGNEDDDDDDDDDGFGLDDAADVADIYDAANGDGQRSEKRSKKDRRREAKKRLKRMKARTAKPGFFSRLNGKAGGLASRVGQWGMFNTDIVKGAAKGAGAVAKPLIGAGSAALGGAAAVGGAAAKGLAGDSKLARLARWGTFNTDIVKGAGKGAVAAGRGVTSLGRAASPLLGKAGLIGALGMGALEGYGALTDDTMGSDRKAKTLTGVAGGAAGGWAGATAGASMGAAVGSVVPIVGTAIGGILGGLIGGAFGYWGGKKLGLGIANLGTWWNKSKLSNLSKLRLAEYGVSADDGDGMDKVFQLESMLEPYSTIKEDGNFYLDEKEVDFKEIAELFGVVREQDMQLFNLWYRRRFVPVYRFWLTELRKVSKEGKLKNIESIIPGKDKLTIAQKSVSSLSDAYSHNVGWNQSRTKLAYNAEGVQQVLDSMQILLQKERESAGGEKATVENKTTVASTTASAKALAEKALTDKANYTVKDKDGKEVDASSMELGELTEKIKTGAVTVSVAIAVPQNLMHTDNKTLDALTSIRYKAYGLSHITADKARVMSALEMTLGEYLGGDPNVSKLSMGSDDIMKVAGEVFGVPNSTGEHANRWKAWFNGRFLPVFLLWAGTIRKKTGKNKLKAASDAFPLEEQLPLGRAIIAQTGINAEGGRVSVWKILSNPFLDAYELNSDPDSTAGNMEAIRQLADKVRLGEMTATGKQAGPASKNGLDKDGKPLTTMGKISNWFGGPMNPASTNTRGVNATGDTISGVGKDAKPLSGIGDAIRFSGGGSGNYTELPTPTGAGWTANRELLLKAAAMAGVDPRALITTVAVESSFNPNAAPKNPNLPSSAKGLGQHLDSSWMEDLRLHGKKFGIPNGTTQFDARASALMTASRLRYNGEQLEKNLGRSVTMTDLYLAHLMGLGGATKFLKAPADAIGAEEAPTSAKQHPEYFYEGSRAATVKEVYAKFAQKLAKRPAEFGVTDADMKSTNVATEPASAPAGAPAGVAPAAAATSAPSTGAAAPTAAPAAQPQAAPAPKAPSYATTPSAGSPSLNQPVTMAEGKSAVMGNGPAMVIGKGIKYELILQREDSEEDGTYGTLRFPDGTVLNTLELPWKNNEAQVSCIPPGIYPCKMRSSKHFGETYEVQNVQGRSAILIHAGNSAGSVDKGHKADSKGCILLGMDRGRKGSQKVITASKAAMHLFHEKMGGQPFTLIVRGSKNAMTAVDGKSSVSLDPMRQSTASGTATPTPATVQPSQAATQSFTPQTKVNTGVVGSAPAPTSDLPRLNKTDTGFSPTSPSKSDMQQRDAAMTATIAPQIEGMANTLLKSLEVQTSGVDVLRQILTALGSKEEPQKSAPVSVNKLKPEASTSVPVPRKRSY